MRDQCGVLLAAHGERGGGADNASVARLAAALSQKGLAAEVRFGFIKGTPAIPDAVAAFTAPQLIVYPLFFADGYFTRVRLPQLIAEAESPRPDRTVTTLPPLGLDPALAPLIVAKASGAARAGEYPDSGIAVILLAHGSGKDAASHRAADELARQVRALNRFASVSCAFLEEPPALDDAVAHTSGPAVVIGLFAGEGLHGREDVPRLIADLRRPDILFAGNVGTWPELADVIAAAIHDSRLHKP